VTEHKTIQLDAANNLSEFHSEHAVISKS